MSKAIIGFFLPGKSEVIAERDVVEWDYWNDEDKVCIEF